MLSIITPVLNGERFIRNNIESIMKLRQTHEHIIVDGGSTDNTMKILSEYQHLRVIRQADNGGMYTAIIQGFNSSVGNFITWINSDDYIIPENFDSMIECLKKNSADLCYSHAYFYYVNKNKKKLIKSSVFPKYLLSNGIMPFVQPASIYKRDFYNRIGGLNPKYRIAGDLDLFYRMGCDKLAHMIIYPKPTVVFLKHGESLGDKNTEKSHIERRDAGIPNNTLLSRIVFYLGKKLIYF